MNNQVNQSLVGKIVFLTSVNKEGKLDYDCGDYIIIQCSDDGRVIQAINLSRLSNYNSGELCHFIVGGGAGQCTIGGVHYDEVRARDFVAALRAFP